jgi:hypothetical protein
LKRAIALILQTSLEPKHQAQLRQYVAMRSRNPLKVSNRRAFRSDPGLLSAVGLGEFCFLVHDDGLRLGSFPHVDRHHRNSHVRIIAGEHVSVAIGAHA